MRVIFQVQAPWRAYIQRGDLTGFFLCDCFGGLIHGGAYFLNFAVIYCQFTYEVDYCIRFDSPLQKFTSLCMAWFCYLQNWERSQGISSYMYTVSKIIATNRAWVPYQSGFSPGIWQGAIDNNLLTLNYFPGWTQSEKYSGSPAPLSVVTKNPTKHVTLTSSFRFLLQWKSLVVFHSHGWLTWNHCASSSWKSLCYCHSFHDHFLFHHLMKSHSQRLQTILIMLPMYDKSWHSKLFAIITVYFLF